MPSEKILESKKVIVSNIVEKLNSAVSGVVVDYKGIPVDEDTKLRKELREAGVEYFVVKNKLLKIAFDQTGLSGLDNVLEGSTAIAISDNDATAPAKILFKKADDSKKYFNLKGGFMEGEILDVAGVESLAKIPSKEALLSMLCSALQGNIRGLACAINAIAEKQNPDPEEVA